MIFYLFLILIRTAMAVPPEAFENFSVINKDKASTHYALGVSYHNPIWRTDYEILSLQTGTPLGENHYISAGLRNNFAPEFGDRSAYFLRYDLKFLSSNSIALKGIYEEWEYIASSKTSLSIDYNTFFKVAQNSGFYLSLGLYHRWLRQRWNNPWNSPLNFDTQDKEYSIQGALGWKVGINNQDFITIDMNTKDHYSFYNLDNIGFDLVFNFIGDGFIWRIGAGVRTAALFMGTGEVSEYSLSTGFYIY